MQYWQAAIRESVSMAGAFVTLNLPLSIVYLYQPETRHWSLMALLAIPGLVLPALCAVTRLYRLRAGAATIGASCAAGGALAAGGHHLAMMVLAHIGIYLGDQVGFSRLPAALQADLSFWKKHFAEVPGYWWPPLKDVLDVTLMFGVVAALTFGWLATRQRLLAAASAPR